MDGLQSNAVANNVIERATLSLFQITGLPSSQSVGRASSRAITAGRLLYANEAKALGECADFLLGEGEGKLVLAWLAGRSPYQ